MIAFLFRGVFLGSVVFSCLKRKVLLLLPASWLLSFLIKHCLYFLLKFLLTRMLSFSWHINSESHGLYREKHRDWNLIYYILELFLSPYFLLQKCLYVAILSSLILKHNKDALFTKLFVLIKYYRSSFSQVIFANFIIKTHLIEERNVTYSVRIQ